MDESKLFNRNDRDETMEPASDVEISPMMEPSAILACEVPSSPPPQYWQAQNFAETLHREFEDLQKKGDKAGMKERFFVLAHYYGRTLGILRQALSKGREPLIKTALFNLVTLHQPLHHMHTLSPTTVPFAVTLNRETRSLMVDDLIIEVLHDAVQPLAVGEICGRVNDLHILVDVKPASVQEHLEAFIDQGYVSLSEGGYIRTKRPYSYINLDQAGLRALLGTKLYKEFEKNGFPGLSSLTGRKTSFLKFFESFAGCGTSMAEMFIAASKELLGPPSLASDLKPWPHRDLIGSIHPRPYQHDAFFIFRGYGYKGEVIEAPTGSGKTMIGMMCIQDWLRGLSEGEAILILVPTVNYEQQWVGELCYKSIGLRLAPEHVFAGTPAALEILKKRSGIMPAVVIMTYTALAQMGSPTGKGGFDLKTLEKFLQGNRIQYIVLDEVHKLVDDLKSVSADLARLLTEWMRDGSIRGIIGFSGTAAVYRSRFKQLGLKLVYTLPAADLIAYGFVAPFAELGLPFAFSDREKKVRTLIDSYKQQIFAFTGLVGGRQIRNWFADIPMSLRSSIGADDLGLYASAKDRTAALTARFSDWEKGDKLSLSELPMVTIVQIVKHWSDERMFEESLRDLEEKEKKERRRLFSVVFQELENIRLNISGLILFPDILKRLKTNGFGKTFPADILQAAARKPAGRKARLEDVRDAMAATTAGLYTSLKNFYFRVGEGRVDSIKAVLAAERASRRVTGMIVFDRGKRIRWKEKESVPGYSGVAGVFAQMLDEPKTTPLAVLSSEIYLPAGKSRLPEKIAAFIRDSIMFKEQGEALWGLISLGLPLDETQKPALHDILTSLLKNYILGLTRVGAARPGEFNRMVLRRFLRQAHKLKVSSPRLTARLSLKNFHLLRWIDTFFDYGLIAERFQSARQSSLRLAGGEIRNFYVVRMAGGDRKQLMYDLTARIVDAERLPVNMIIISTWARTGWNVISPNILIDATATRNVTAWQQLRGRAMRARASWDKSCYTAVMLLLGAPVTDLHAEETPENEPVKHRKKRLLDPQSRILLREALLSAGEKQAAPADQELLAKIETGRLSAFSLEEKELLVSSLMLARNKVTHIYELVKAYGSTPQVVFSQGLDRWVRRESIAAKHTHEYSVSPLTGSYGPGEAHAPLLYTTDPRTNLPSQTRRLLKKTLIGVDRTIVGGWIEAILSGERKEADIG